MNLSTGDSQSPTGVFKKALQTVEPAQLVKEWNEFTPEQKQTVRSTTASILEPKINEVVKLHRLETESLVKTLNPRERQKLEDAVWAGDDVQVQKQLDVLANQDPKLVGEILIKTAASMTTILPKLEEGASPVKTELIDLALERNRHFEAMKVNDLMSRLKGTVYHDRFME
jgi:hypothetical protein